MKFLFIYSGWNIVLIYAFHFAVSAECYGNILVTLNTAMKWHEKVNRAAKLREKFRVEKYLISP